MVKISRTDGRKFDQLRPVKIIRRYTRYAPGSVLIEVGNTRVLCTANFEQAVPGWKIGTGGGWLTAEYSMLPSSTPERKRRNTTKIDGRSQEIQRLIGRALRAVIDLDKLGENTIWIDCDVLQADGGTRTASITGAYVALVDAIEWAKKEGLINENPINAAIAAISAGIVENRIMLDLNYEEDSIADVDFNIIMTDKGKLVEIQGTAEHKTFSQKQLMDILKLAKKGINQLFKIQRKALNEAIR